MSEEACFAPRRVATQSQLKERSYCIQGGRMAAERACFLYFYLAEGGGITGKTRSAARSLQHFAVAVFGQGACQKGGSARVAHGGLPLRKGRLAARPPLLDLNSSRPHWTDLSPGSSLDF
jgi:hypothetical protein